MTAGYFTRTYALWQLILTESGPYNETIEEWVKYADVPGRAYPTRLTDTFAAARQQGIVAWTFATPADTPITNGDEIRFDGRVLTVQAVSVTSSGERIEALCEERQ